VNEIATRKYFLTGNYVDYKLVGCPGSVVQALAAKIRGSGSDSFLWLHLIQFSVRLGMKVFHRAEFESRMPVVWEMLALWTPQVQSVK